MLRKRKLIFTFGILTLVLIFSMVVNIPLDLRLLLLTPKIIKYRALIEQHAAKEALDAHLVYALIVQESGFDEKARSAVGAQGLTQLMPITAKELGVENPLDAAQNIAGAARHLRRLYNALSESPDAHRHQLVLASYNSGLGRVRDAQALVRHGKAGNPLFWEPVSRTLSQLTQKQAHLHREVWESGKPPHGYFEGSDETIDYVRRVMDYYARIRFYDRLLSFL